ncbi:unnamed protein product [Ixodes hexagonus]
MSTKQEYTTRRRHPFGELPPATQTLFVASGGAAFLVALALSVFFSLDSYSRAVLGKLNLTSPSPSPRHLVARQQQASVDRATSTSPSMADAQSPAAQDQQDRIALPIEDDA